MRCYARILCRGKKRWVKIETRNALRGRSDGKHEGLIIQKYSRGNDLWTRLKPSVFKKTMQQSQRLRRDKFTADFLPGKAVFFQQQHLVRLLGPR